MPRKKKIYKFACVMLADYLESLNLGKDFVNYAEAYATEQGMNERINKDLITAFPFESTKEGSEYWADVQLGYVKHCKKIRSVPNAAR